MAKKWIIAMVLILAVVVAFAACKKNEEDPQTNPSTTEEPSTEVTTAVDEKGAYVFNENNEKVYLQDQDGFFIDANDAVILEGNDPDEETTEGKGFFIGGATDGEKEDSISWDEIVGKNS